MLLLVVLAILAIALFGIGFASAAVHFLIWVAIIVALIWVIMFFAGVALACREVLGWWKARMDRFERPPLPKLITYEIDSDRRWLPGRFPGSRGVLCPGRGNG